MLMKEGWRPLRMDESAVPRLCIWTVGGLDIQESWLNWKFYNRLMEREEFFVVIQFPQIASTLQLFTIYRMTIEGRSDS